MTSMESARSFGTSAPHHHSTLPASPTLTNPDMILPDYDRAISPVGLGDPMQSLWRAAQAAHASIKQHASHNSDAHQYNQYAPTHPDVNTPTPIIYGNGTMLSDIGEVTEAESTPARPSPPRTRYGPPAPAVPSMGLEVDDSEGDAALRSSPTIGKSSAIGGVKKRAKAAHKERRSSIDSNSTITDHDQAPKIAVFDDFDDTVSVEDSVCQGDDEESLASSYVDDTSLASGPVYSSGLNNRDNGQKYSTAQLSKRAEHILANAKKRLTHMEDNLSRARSSLLVASNYTGSTPSSPSPPIAKASVNLMMSTNGQTSPASGHHRTGSDNSLRIGIPIKVYPQRSSSVLGISTGPRHPGLTVSRSADQLNGHFNRQRASYTVIRDLEPLGEDDVAQPQRRSEYGNPHRYSSLTSPTFGPSADKGLARSASTSHMRDLKDQVNDLKGKISSLREQARADSLKRSSLQNLRTTSPFTHAKVEQWYSQTVAETEAATPVENAVIPSFSGDTADDYRSPNGYFEAQNSGNLEDSYSSHTPRDIEGVEIEDGDRLESLSPEPFEYDIGIAVDHDNEDLLTENGDVEKDGVIVEESGTDIEEAAEDSDDLVSESGGSIYHESVQNHLSHEDREDAFDYEHFFLHSAMGTISQRLARRESDASFTSEDSVETTRGPIVESDSTDEERTPSMLRRGSDASVSTMESFATAKEGLSSRQSTSLDLDRQEEAGEDDEAADTVTPEAFPVLHSSDISRPETPPTAKRATFAGVASPSRAVSSPSGTGRSLDDLYSAVRRPMSSAAMTRPHAPSVSSMTSIGTTRSFPLVNRPTSKSSSSGIMTPEGRSSGSDGRTTSVERTSQTGGASSGDTDSRHHSISLHSTNSATSLIEQNGTTAVMETLQRDDQILVERLVASLGRCVLGVTENSRASTEARMYRRRIDAARKILEGFEKV